ncbi:MAG: efflux RND transporter periplasmic adaptor subunit [Hyphomicrobiales bacterium]
MQAFNTVLKSKIINTMKSTHLFKSTGKLMATAALLSLVTYACSSPEEIQKESENPVPVTVETAALNKVSASLTFSGTVKSERTVNLSTKVMGRITRLDVETGDFVRKGAPLVRIKDDNLRAQKNQIEANLSQARAALQNTETNYKRLKALHEKGSTTQKEFDDISTQYESAKANVKAFQGKLLEINDMLDYTVLEAPFDGYVVAKRAAEGDLAGPGEPLVTFEQQGAMKVAVSVPETNIHLFELKDAVSVEVGAAGINQAQGVVSSVSPSGDRASRQFEVEITLPRQKVPDPLKSGMFAEVSLNSMSDSSITVPLSALIERGQLTGLYAVSRDNEALLRWVRTGQAAGERIEILSGLSEGETYVVSSKGRLTEGQKIQIQ